MKKKASLWALIGMLMTFSLFFTFVRPSAAEGEYRPSDRRVAYRIDVRLDPERKELIGQEQITWRNPGKKPVQEMYLHLYPNAFSKGSTFVRESGGQLRGDRMDFQAPGSMEITRLTFADGSDGLSRFTYVQPDDQNPRDRTLARLQLPQPVYPGEEIALQIDFRVQLPKVFARMGYHGDFVMAGQWFPKVAVYEVKGQRQRKEEGWNAHQYHAKSEFYADFGTYEVNITLPEEYVVAATGRITRQPRATGEGWLTHTFWAQDVHDFAWAASPDFVVRSRDYGELGERGITVQLYLDPLHAELAERYFDVVYRTMKQFGEWFGPYPYDTLSVVVPPPGARGAGGMEYPTLITAWDASVPTQGLAIEQVVVHELAHQYWYGIVANNEFEEAWLDEGFATYSENRMMTHYLQDYLRYTLMQPILYPQSLTLPAWEYTHDAYADNVYNRGSRVLEGIAEVVGPRTMDRILQAYFAQYRFGHPSTLDFLRVVNQVSGRDFTDYFDRFVYGSQMVDLMVSDIQSSPAEAGRFMHRITLAAQNSIGQTVPVLVRFADGSVQTIHWNSMQNPYVWELEGPPIRYVWIDPTFGNPMEIAHLNNQRQVFEDSEVRFWHQQAAFWLEFLVRWLL